MTGPSFEPPRFDPWPAPVVEPTVVKPAVAPLERPLSFGLVMIVLVVVGVGCWLLGYWAGLSAHDVDPCSTSSLAASCQG